MEGLRATGRIELVGVSTTSSGSSLLMAGGSNIGRERVHFGAKTDSVGGVGGKQFFVEGVFCYLTIA